MATTEVWLRLMRVNGLYGDAQLAIGRRLCQASAVDAALLRALGFSATQISHYFSLTPAQLYNTLQWLDLPGHTLLLAESPSYPPALRAVSDYPAALFVAGNPHLLALPQIAVVGSRSHSWYGERWGALFCEGLARLGLCITSGLALGIDGVAHRAALNVKGKTIAVLGNGLNHTYPRRHNALATQILDGGGALVSEFPLHETPWPGNFPRRNRIISGLSLGVLVVEAAIKSGSLVTARCALEQGRDVFALPGPLGSPGSAGPHWLIQQGAIPATCIEDIVGSLQNELKTVAKANENTKYSPDTEDAALPFPELLANVGDEVTSVDVVAERAGQPVPETVAQLLELELAGWIAAVPGGYVRLRRACHVRRTNVLV
ncbi:DNA-protecting protein DprA [Pluralibacter gergoviae]|uniref:DNA-protecting protein DprA n=1 Tax=Pluralibacter gergoviae TaxID=61647 RepID=UPI0006ACA475|nr:DNA-protecting protein DprA [Pluralibacter gergoviae]KOR01767.1 DNA processing protein DprA [Pluralibacter gergoviae]MDU4005785.1 DNA-protecting protein DprA [Pluralibacter gergoviae]